MFDHDEGSDRMPTVEATPPAALDTGLLGGQDVPPDWPGIPTADPDQNLDLAPETVSTPPSDLDRYGPVPDHIRETWTQLQEEKGRCPTSREFREAAGGNHERREAWRRLLIREALRPQTEADAVAACRAALAKATADVEGWRQEMQQAESERAQHVETLQDLEKRRIHSDDVTLEQMEAATRALWHATIRMTEILPPLGAPFLTAETEAEVQLEQAIEAATLARRNALAAQRLTHIAGPLQQTLDAFLEEFQSARALIDEQRQCDSALRLPVGQATRQLIAWLYTALAPLAPYPPRQSYASVPVVADLVASDPTLAPVSPEALASTAGTGTVFVQYTGREVPNFSSQGLERLRGNPVNQRVFARRGTIEVTYGEYEALRQRYGAAVETVEPDIWR